MRADDVTDTLKPALVASGCDSAKVVHKPRLLSDNGSNYISSDLAEWLKDRALRMFAAPRAIRRPRARSSAGTLKNRVLLENYSSNTTITGVTMKACRT
jgi:putative transposase